MTGRRFGFGLAVLGLLLAWGCQEHELEQLQPDIWVSPEAVEFGTVTIGVLHEQVLEIHDIGNGSLEVQQVVLADGTGRFAVEEFSGTIAPDEHVSLVVSFDPDDYGPAEDLIQIHSDDPDEPLVEVPVTVIDVVDGPIPAIAWSPNALEFGEVPSGGESTLSVTVSSVGTADLEIAAVDLDGTTAPEFTLTLDPAPLSLAPGYTTQVDVTFAPTEEGLAEGLLLIESNDPDVPLVEIPLSGELLPSPDIELVPTQLLFGDVEVGNAVSMNAEIWNLGDADLELGTLALVGSTTEFALHTDPSGVVLVPGDYAMVTVSYTPDDMNADVAEVEIPSNDPDENPAYLLLAGQHEPIPDIEVTPLQVDFGLVDVGTTSSDAIMLTNVGTGDLSVDLPVLTGSVDFAMSAAQFPLAIAPNTSELILVDYTPSDLLPDTGDVTITSDDPDEAEIHVTLLGDATPAPDIDLIPTALAFGAVQIGHTSALSATILNVGTADLELGTLTVLGTSEYTLSLDPSGTTLAPGALATVEVTYAPVDTGTDSAQVEIPSNDPDENPIYLDLDGEEDPTPDIEVDPLTVDFGQVDVTSWWTETVTVSNVGTADLDVSALTLTGSADFTWSSAALPAVLAPGGSGAVYVTYEPTDHGADTATLTIDSDDPDEPSVDVTITGEATPYPDIDVDPLTVDFGDAVVLITQTAEVTIGNLGDGDLELYGCSYTGDTQFWISSNPQGATIAPGDEVVLEVSFQASASTSYTGLIEVASNDPFDPIVTVDILGGGIEPDIELDPVQLDYGMVAVGSSLTMDSELRNVGTADLELGALVLSGTTEFEIVVDPSLEVLAPGDSTWVSVSYTPADMGGDSATVEIPSNDPDENPAYLALIGQHDPIQDIDVTPTSIWFSGVDVGQVGNDTITVENVGTGDLWVDMPVLSGSSEFMMNANAFPMSIPAGGSQTIAVVYTPTDFVTDNGEVTITSDDPDEPTVVVPLTGDATPVPDIEVVPTSIQFGAVQIGSSVALTASIGNVGIADLELGTLVVNGTAEFAITHDPSMEVLAPGDTTVVEVTYSPIDTGGDNALLEIPSNDPDENPVNVSLNGAEDPVPDIDVDPMQVDFGAVDIGNTDTATVTVSNLGGATLDVTAVALGGSSDFSWASANLPGTIPASGTRSIVVAYTPSDEVADSGTLTIDSDDPDEPSVVVALSGAHTPEPDIDADPWTLDFGDVDVLDVETDVVTLTNLGDGDLEITACTYAGDAVFWISGDPSGSVVAAGDSVELEISFEPDDELTYVGLVDVASNDPDEPVIQIDIIGGGVAPDIDLDPTALNFGSVQIGTSDSLDAEIWNVGGADLDLGTLSLSGSAEFTISVDPSGAVVAPGGYTVVRVTYTPVDTTADTGTVEIPSNDPDEDPVYLQLAGAHEPVPDIDVSPTTVDFGSVDVGTTSTQTVTVGNVGSGDLLVGIPVLSGTPEFSLSVTSFPVTLVPGDSRTFTVSYTPYDQTADTGTITIDSDDPDEPQVEVDVSGQATPEPDIDVTPLVHQFGQVQIGQSSALSSTISNVGTDDLDLTSLTISGTTEYTITVDPTGEVLAAGDSTTVEVTYTPVDVGADSGTLDIASNDPDEPVVSVTLNGADEPLPDIDVDPLTVAFGTVVMGNVETEDVTVSNLGTASLTVNGISYSGSADFNWMSANLPGVVPAGGSRTIVVTYMPADEVADSGTLTIDSDDPDEPSVAVAIEGQPAPNPDIYVDPWSYDFGEVKVTASASTTFTISNIGDVDLELYSCVRSGDPNFSISVNPQGAIIAPGASEALEVEFYPTAETSYSATIDIASDDPDEPIVSVDVYGDGVTPEIEITPDYHDFGDVVVDCDDSVDIEIASVGTAPLSLYGWSFGGDAEMDIDAVTLDSYVNNGWDLNPGNSIMVTVTFEPTDVHTYLGLLSVQSDDPSQPTATADQDGEGVPDGYATDSFTQVGNNESDVLWVVDNSCSMGDEQGQLGDDFSYFYSVVTAAGVDYRIATVTTDDEDFQGSPAVITPTTPNGAVEFADNCLVGTWGSATERGLQYGYNALSQAINNQAPNTGFWRQDAGLRVVYVSDENDQSGNWSSWLSSYQALKADPDYVVLSAICGTDGYVAQSCSGPGGSAYPGTGYVDVANATGGVLGSICESDWSTVLTNLAWITVNLADTFELSYAPIPSTIDVYVNGVQMFSGWTYDAGQNAVVFDPAFIPADGDSIVIDYGTYGAC